MESAPRARRTPFAKRAALVVARLLVVACVSAVTASAQPPPDPDPCRPNQVQGLGRFAVESVQPAVRYVQNGQQTQLCVKVKITWPNGLWCLSPFVSLFGYDENAPPPHIWEMLTVYNETITNTDVQRGYKLLEVCIDVPKESRYVVQFRIACAGNNLCNRSETTPPRRAPFQAGMRGSNPRPDELTATATGSITASTIVAFAAPAASSASLSAVAPDGWEITVPATIAIASAGLTSFPVAVTAPDSAVAGTVEIRISYPGTAEVDEFVDVQFLSVVFNEFHADGAAAGLVGDYIEIWNRTPHPIDLAGWHLGIWAGDAGQLRSLKIPGGFANTWIKGNDFYVLQEGGELGDPLTDPQLAGVVGMRLGTSPFFDACSVGAFLVTPGGGAVDYAYLRRGVSPPPASPPHAQAIPFVLGNVAADGAGFSHLKRMTNADVGSCAEWTQDASATAGTPGAVNDANGATQATIGPPTYRNEDVAAFGQPDVAAGLTMNGETAAVFPRFASAAVGAPTTLALQGAPGAPFVLLLSEHVNSSHLELGAFQFDLGAKAELFADVLAVDPSGLVPLSALAAPTGFLDGSGHFALVMPAPFLLHGVGVQAAVFTPTGVEISSAVVVETYEPGTTYATALGGSVPDGTGAPLTLALTTPPGTTITDVDMGFTATHGAAGHLLMTLAFGGVARDLAAPIPTAVADLAGDYVFTDEGWMSYVAAEMNGSVVVRPGRYAPIDALAAFDGLDSGAGGGVWTLTVRDSIAGGGGSLAGFSITLNGGR